MTEYIAFFHPWVFMNTMNKRNINAQKLAFFVDMCDGVSVNSHIHFKKGDDVREEVFFCSGAPALGDRLFFTK